MNCQPDGRRSGRPPFLIVTGIPRAGTTLTAAILDRLDGVICLNEPPRYYSWARPGCGAQAFVDYCLRDLNSIYDILSRGGSITDNRQCDGEIPTNYYDQMGQRRPLTNALIAMRESANPLVLAVKHNELFTSVLPELCVNPDVAVLAITRSPREVFTSWSRVAIPLSEGRLSRGYALWREANEASAMARTTTDLQSRIYRLYTERYAAHGKHIKIMSYEEIIDDPCSLARWLGRKPARLMPEITKRSVSPQHKRD